MLSRLRRIDRRLAATGLVLVASLALLSAGLFTIVTTLGDGVDLPAEGSLQDILDEGNVDADDLAATATAGPSGPPPPAPVALDIPRLYVNAPVVAMGLGPDRQPQVPDAPDQVAWYTFTAAPGTSSNAVFSGHVDWLTSTGAGIPGVFYRLRELQIGDAITVTLEGGDELQYRVTGNVATVYDDPNVLKVMGATSKDVITLITCGGTWQKDYRAQYGGNYSHRIVVRAERVAGSGAGGG